MIALATINAPRIGVTIEVGDDLRIYVDAKPEFHDAVLRLVRVIDDAGEWVRDYDVPASVEGVAHEIARALGAEAEVVVADALYEGWEGDLVPPDPKDVVAEARSRGADAAFGRARVRDSDQPRCSELEEGKPGRFTNEDGDGCEGAEGKAKDEKPDDGWGDLSDMRDELAKKHAKLKEPVDLQLHDGSVIDVADYLKARDGGLPWFGGGPDGYAEIVAAKRAGVIEKGASATPEMVEALQRYIDAGKIAVQVDGHLLDEIARDGFLNQFDTKTSNGTLSAPIRALAEQDLFGINPASDGAGRPVYGFVYQDGSAYDRNWSLASQYGGVTAILKDDAKADTTIYDGDSLSQHGWSFPSEMGGKVSVDTLRPRPKKSQYYPGYDPNHEYANMHYLEAQVHRRLSLDDVFELRMNSPSAVPLDAWLFLREKYPDLVYKNHDGKLLDVDKYIAGRQKLGW